MRAALYASLLLCLAFVPKKDKHREQFIYDDENAFSTEERTRLDTLLRGHELRTTNEIVLITTETYRGWEDLALFAASCGDSLKVGKPRKDNGVVIVFSKQLREVYIAAGLGTEQVMAPARSQKYIDSLMIPLFKENMFFDGIWAGTNAVVNHLELPENRMD